MKNLNSKSDYREMIDPVSLNPVGPNGHRLGYSEEGDLAELIPDENNPSKKYPMILRRNDDAIKKEYEALWDIVWWNRNKNRLDKIEARDEPLSESQLIEIKGNKESLLRVANKYGKDSLEVDAYDYGLISGRMSALAWVKGAEWDESLDT